jgi:hypothetical protein
VTSLEQRLDAHDRVVRHNAQQIHVAFRLTDAHTAVHYRLLNDLQKDAKRGLELDEHGQVKAPEPSRLYLTTEGDIDMLRYHMEYHAVLAAYDFMMPVKKEPAVEEESVHDRETDPNGFVPLPNFGGDYGARQQG